MSSEDAPPVSGDAEPTTESAEAVPAEKPIEPGEEWIEEYESDRKEKAPRKRIPHPLGIVVAVSIVLILVVWTLLSPQVLPEAGDTYVRSQTYANLGNYTGSMEIWWLFNLVLVADTTWGVSISGDQDVSVGQPATFQVLVTKVNEDMKNSWFVGTSINLKNVQMFIDDGPLVGSMVSESSEPFGPMADVEATFDSQGTYDCHVYAEMTVYGKMIVGYLPVKVVRITAYLDVGIVVS